MMHDLEYALSQYLDGSLPPLERDALDERLATDTEARRMLAEFQRLEAELKAALPPPDDVDHDALHARILAAVHEEEPPEITRTYALPWVSSAASGRWVAAVAAVVIVGVTLVALLLGPQAGTMESTHGIGGPVIAQVAGPQPQATSAPPVQNISIGPSTAISRGGMEWNYDDVIVVRPSRIIIASSVPAGQDSGGPY